MIFKQYLQVTKPSIIFGNLISVIGGILAGLKRAALIILFIYTLNLGCHWLWRRVVCCKLHRQGYRQKDGKDEESGAG